MKENFLIEIVNRDLYKFPSIARCSAEIVKICPNYQKKIQIGNKQKNVKKIIGWLEW